MDITRDARTVFVTQLVSRAGEDWIHDYFAQVGAVTKVTLIRDRVTNRSKGTAYVEFAELDSVPRAHLLNGQKMCMKHKGCTCSGFPIVVQPSGAERNYAAQAEKSEARLQGRGELYLGNIAPSLDEAALRDVFASIDSTGKVVQNIRINESRTGDPAARHAVVSLSSPDIASEAMKVLNGVELAGQALRAGLLIGGGQVKGVEGDTWMAHDPSKAGLSAQARAMLMANLAGATQTAIAQMSSLGGAAAAALAGAAATGTVNESGGAGEGAAAGAGEEAEEDEEEEDPPLHPTGTPSSCLVISRMWSKQAAKRFDRDDWQDIIYDLEDEIDKHGRALHSALDRSSAEREAWVMVQDEETGTKAGVALSGRFYNKRKVGIRFVSLEEYERRWPDAAGRQKRYAKFLAEFEDDF